MGSGSLVVATVVVVFDADRRLQELGGCFRRSACGNTEKSQHMHVCSGKIRRRVTDMPAEGEADLRANEGCVWCIACSCTWARKRGTEKSLETFFCRGNWNLMGIKISCPNLFSFYIPHELVEQFLQRTAVRSLKISTRPNTQLGSAHSPLVRAFLSLRVAFHASLLRQGIYLSLSVSLSRSPPPLNVLCCAVCPKYR